MFNKFFSYNYWFVYQTTPFSRSDKYFFAGSIILFFAAFFLQIISAYGKNFLRRDFIRRWAILCWTIGIFALIWSGLRQQLIRTLSARIVVACIYLAGLVWAVWLVRYYFKTYKAQKAEYEKEQLKRKYL